MEQEARARTVVTNFSKCDFLGDDVDEDDLENIDDCFKRDVIEDLLSIRSGGYMSCYWTFDIRLYFVGRPDTS